MSIAHDDRYFDNAYSSPTSVWQPVVTPDRHALPYLLSFRGRATRSQFWAVSILTNIAYIAVLMLTAERLESINNPLVNRVVFFGLLAVYMWVSTAIQVKRCHDLDKSGIFVLIGFIPVVGMLWRIVYLGCFPGTPGENLYGPSPLQAGSAGQETSTPVQSKRFTESEYKLCFVPNAESQSAGSSAPTAELRWM